MNTKFMEAREYIAKAREALRRGDKQVAHQLGAQAALLAPDMEDAWLVLVASDPNPQDALFYARKALEINPESTRARRSVEWAKDQVKQAEAGNARVLTEANNRKDMLASLPKRVDRGATPSHPSKINGPKWFYPVLLIGAGCIAFGFAALFALTNPAFASIVSNVSAPVSTKENLWAPMNIAKPSVTPIDVRAFAPQVADAPGSAPSNDTASIPANTPTLAATEAPNVTPAATETPGTMAMEIVDDTLVNQSVSSVGMQVQYLAKGNGERWIDVNLSEQRVYAYEGDTVVDSFVVSTGVPQTPTVTGQYKVYVKYRKANMSGPGYFLPDVPYIMYFYQGYGLHGTYWHNNFGTPMSRGCVNLSIPDAEWLYNWASVGTIVNVHY